MGLATWESSMTYRGDVRLVLSAVGPAACVCGRRLRRGGVLGRLVGVRGPRYAPGALAGLLAQVPQ